MSKKKQILSSNQVAVEAVERWFQHVTSTFYESDGEGKLIEAFDAVSQALEAEYVAQHGPIADDDTGRESLLDQEAGYMVGVQVGLRLRNAAEVK